MSDIIEIKGERFRKMQLLELGMIKELDRVCRMHDINYILVSGTLLGAIRHKGFIPWDDDADIAMLREDYEKFKKHLDDLDPAVCFFQDHETDPEYRWGYGKLRRTGTKHVRVGQEHLKCKTGIFVDVFALDDVPLSLIGQWLQNFHCLFLRKVLWSEVGKYSEKGFLKLWYSLLSKIPADRVFKWMNVYIKKSNNSTPNRVRALTLPSLGTYYYKSEDIKDRYGLPKEWFLERAEYEFEGELFYGPKDYDSMLRLNFRNYMELPPEDQRVAHAPVVEIQFPDE